MMSPERERRDAHRDDDPRPAVRRSVADYADDDRRRRTHAEESPQVDVLFRKEIDGVTSGTLSATYVHATYARRPPASGDWARIDEGSWSTVFGVVLTSSSQYSSADPTKWKSVSSQTPFLSSLPLTSLQSRYI